MTKKKTTRRKEAGGDLEKEIVGVHVINNADIKTHFGAAENKIRVEEQKNEDSQIKSMLKGEKAAVTEEDSAKVKVSFLLDKVIWRQTAESAAKQNLELSEYVETALASFNRYSAKNRFK